LSCVGGSFSANPNAKAERRKLLNEVVPRWTNALTRVCRGLGGFCDSKPIWERQAIPDYETNPLQQRNELFRLSFP
jgi:hypothetical protein